MSDTNLTHFITSLWKPDPDSHKGQNGRVCIIGGSTLFTSACLWPLTVASRIVDLVHFASTEQNNAIVTSLKTEFRNGIVIGFSDLETYIKEDDAILIGPGMERDEKELAAVGKNSGNTSPKMSLHLRDIAALSSQGQITKHLTNYLLRAFPSKQWVIDAGSLYMMDPRCIPHNAILTPHEKEFEALYSHAYNKTPGEDSGMAAKQFSTDFDCIIVLKGKTDRVYGPKAYSEIPGGNVGMTKGGTGDVLSGLITALAAKNDPYTAAVAGCFINKRAGEALFRTFGPFYHASDLALQVPKTMAELLYGISLR